MVRGIQVAPWFGAILSLLTVGTVWPSTSQAGCLAHYASSRWLADNDAAHLELLGLAETAPAATAEAPGERPRPCTGALCSGNPAPPLSTMPRVVPTVLVQWALPLTPLDLSAPGSIAFPTPEAGLRPIDAACTIFHPPRLPLLSASA